MEGKFNWKYFIFGNGKEDWYKALGNGARYTAFVVAVILILWGGVSLWRFFFPKAGDNVFKPTVIALPFSKIEKVELSNTQKMEQKRSRLHFSLGGGGITYDSKLGTFVGAWVTYDF